MCDIYGDWMARQEVELVAACEEKPQILQTASTIYYT